MMFVDRQGNYLNWLKISLSYVTNPIQYTVNLPFYTVAWLEDNVSSRYTLMSENTQLRYQQIILKAKLQKLTSLQKENSKLRSLLKSSSHQDIIVKAAQLLAIGGYKFKKTITLDQGGLVRVYIGQPVVDDYGIMGQVINVYPKYSVVLLVTDSNSAIPVQSERSGERIIVQGNDLLDYLSADHVAKTADLKVGDILISSGLGQRFPEGYPVGEIIKVSKVPGEKFAKIQIEPAAHLNRSRVVLLLDNHRKWIKTVEKTQNDVG